MPKKPTLKEYEVPMRLSYNAFVYVKAASPEEAREVAKSGEWSCKETLSEMYDWETSGEPVENS